MPIEQLPIGPSAPGGAPFRTRTRTRSATARATYSAGAGQHEHELVAAVAGDLVVGADLRAQGVGHAAQQASPAGWPSSSLTRLKSSRSISTQQSGWLSRAARAISSRTRTCIAPWFSRPVSASVLAAVRTSS